MVSKQVTRATLKAGIAKLLQMRSPAVMSAGELTKALNTAGTLVRRDAVKSACEELRKAGTVFGETKTFWRNGGERRGVAYGKRPTTEEV